MANYEKLKATALRLITKNGKTVTLNRFAKSAADPAKPWRGPADMQGPVAATQTEKAVELGVNNELGSFGKMISKDDIPDCVTDMWMVARTDGNEDLENYDQLIDDEGTAHKIEMAVRIKPGSITILYVLGTSR